MSTKRFICSAVAALTLAGAALLTGTPADARPLGGGFRAGHHGAFHGGFNRGFHGRSFGFNRGFRGRSFGFGAGLALGGLGYGYPYYAGNYGNLDGGCYWQRRVVVNRFGHRFIRPIRVCV
jgi:hypothetical protein